MQGKNVKSFLQGHCLIDGALFLFYLIIRNHFFDDFYLYLDRFYDTIFVFNGIKKFNMLIVVNY